MNLYILNLSESEKDISEHGNSNAQQSRPEIPNLWYAYLWWYAADQLGYVNYDKDIMMSRLFTIDELIEGKLSGASLSDDEKVIPPFFKDAMDSIEKLPTYFFCQKNGEKLFNELNSIHNAVLNIHKQSIHQTTVKDFLN
ncbi:hypothetical protein AVEN_105970-1 [Araneus ventricosus]|uniref:Uncharacterized protein n=1 Tax=Araneus ventricosus TaxID=182803 RepID=A0A4Y2DYQ7_ARAVE|nr:hypothetical protein AVEN_105970-1 [Araneus ventricosus]